MLEFEKNVLNCHNNNNVTHFLEDLWDSAIAPIREAETCLSSIHSSVATGLDCASSVISEMIGPVMIGDSEVKTPVPVKAVEEGYTQEDIHYT